MFSKQGGWLINVKMTEVLYASKQLKGLANVYPALSLILKQTDVTNRDR